MVPDISRMKATVIENRLVLFEPSPALAAFMDDGSRRIIIQAANRTGKTRHCAAKLAGEMLANPGRTYRAVGVDHLQTTRVLGKYLADFIPPSALLRSCRYTQANGWTHQLIQLRNGTTCEMKSCQQDALAHAGPPMHGVLHDEIPDMDILLESLTRVVDYSGWVWIGATPIGRPVEQLRKIIEAEDSPWKPYRIPLSYAACPWYTKKQIDDWIQEARAYPDSFEQKINGAWEGITSERVFNGFTSLCVIRPDDTPPKGVRLGVGFDHGEGAGKQVALLIAYNKDGIWVLAEAINTESTTLKKDAVATVEMLVSRGYDPSQVHLWVGDVNSSGKAGAGRSINELLGAAIAAEAGYRPGSSIRIQSPWKNSVDLGEKLLNAGFHRGQIHVHPDCVQLIKALRHYRGSSKDEDLKHVLDAFRYVSYDILESMNQVRSGPSRYQLQ